MGTSLHTYPPCTLPILKTLIEATAANVPKGFHTEVSTSINIPYKSYLFYLY